MRLLLSVGLLLRERELGKKWRQGLTWRIPGVVDDRHDERPWACSVASLCCTSPRPWIP